MDKFTQEQLLAVAREVMPVEEGFEHTQYEWHFLGNRLVHRESMSLVEFDPETNDTQWKAVVEWCDDHYVLVEPDGSSWRAQRPSSYTWQTPRRGKTPLVARMRAVLYYLENNNG